MKLRKSIQQNQRGQMVIETILLMIVFLAVMGAVKGMLDESEAFKNLTQKPWRVLAGMITSGVWKEPKEAINYHPNLHDRHGMVKGDEI